MSYSKQQYVHNIEDVLAKNKDYFEILNQCTIVSNLVYEDDPIKAAQHSDEYRYLNHGIKNMCVSQIIDDYEYPVTCGLEVKYAVCDCSVGAAKKRLIVAFRGSKTMDDFLVDLQLIGKINDDCAGRLHSGISRRSEMIPLKIFLKKLIEEDYQLVFTGHSLGGAIAALVTTKILLHPAITQKNADNVLFIGFGCPLISCAKFKEYIEPQFYEHFHFYVNDDDLVPRVLAIMSSVIHDVKEVQQNHDYMSIARLLVGAVITPIKKNPSYLSVIGDFSTTMLPKVLQLFLKNVLPNYKPFGSYFRLHRKFTTQIISVGPSTIANVIPEDWLELTTSDTIFNNEKDRKLSNDTDEIIKSFQNHFMKCYSQKLKPFFERYLEGAYHRQSDADIQITIGSLFSIPDKGWVCVEKLDSLKAPSSYNTRVVVNETDCNIFLSIECTNVEYLVSSVLQINNENFVPQTTKAAEEGTGICYVFTIANEILIRNGELIKSSLKCILVSHFNNVTFDIQLIKCDSTGFSFREERIATIPNDLLYIYAASYIYTLQKLGSSLDEDMVTRIEQLKNLLQQLDEIWKISGKPNEYKAEDLQDNLKQYLFHTNRTMPKDEKLLSALFVTFFNDFNVNFASSYVKLADTVAKAKSSKELYPAIIPTVYHLNARQSEMLKIRSTTSRERMTLGGLLLVPFLFVPGVNVAAAAVAYTGFGALLYGSYSFINLYRLSRQHYQGYQTALDYFMKCFGINPDSCIPYFYAQEKAIFNKCKELGIDRMQPQYIIDNWRTVFTNEFIQNITSEHKPLLIQILRTVGVNYRIREIMMQDYFIGVVGRKKCGKSTLVELFGHDAKSDSKHATVEITPYKMVDKVVIFDFPHFESVDTDNKLQFIFSRFILDYLFFVCDAKERGDTADTTNFLNLVKESCGHRFTVILNRADEFWRSSKNHNVSYASEKELNELVFDLCQKLDVRVADNRVLLTCLNHSSVPINELKQLFSAQIYTSDKLLKFIFDVIIRQIPKSMRKQELIDSIIKARDDLVNNNSASDKIIQVRKAGTKFALQVHLIKQARNNCVESDMHEDVNSFEQLVEVLKTNYAFKRPVIKFENSEIIRSFADLFISDRFTYEASDGDIDN